ncbi:unnamed protein product [Rotaria sp. Silwood1]|nr:unnamed protein product [Rotaria sp. Silwood1]CAF3415548.1 unnamed protein product [Rotaria sp. Silwood1]CAF3419309.1 unnamed protein product [Rotaria sp. Silwood1]CAF4653592.1 unnamed protein product [Rotaria sp. Silwood1]CAF5059009.1 unnamed protein product [Rotaria sp. Silwood1]
MRKGERMLENQLNTRTIPSIIDSLDALFTGIDTESTYPSAMDDMRTNFYLSNDYLGTSNGQHTLFYQTISPDQMNIKNSISSVCSNDYCQERSRNSLKNTDDIYFNSFEWHIKDTLTGKLRSPKLDEFLHLLLNNSRYISYASWLNKATGLFEIHNPTNVIELWKRVKNRKSKCNLNYDKFSRSIRYYYNKGTMIATHKRHTYCFAVNK